MLRGRRRGTRAIWCVQKRGVHGDRRVRGGGGLGRGTGGAAVVMAAHLNVPKRHWSVQLKWRVSYSSIKLFKWKRMKFGAKRSIWVTVCLARSWTGPTWSWASPPAPFLLGPGLQPPHATWGPALGPPMPGVAMKARGARARAGGSSLLHRARGHRTCAKQPAQGVHAPVRGPQRQRPGSAGSTAGRVAGSPPARLQALAPGVLSLLCGPLLSPWVSLGSGGGAGGGMGGVVG